jgi:hypothetical protein
MSKLHVRSIQLLIMTAGLPALAGGFMQGEMTEFKHSTCLPDRKTCLSIVADTAVSSQLKALFVLNNVKADLNVEGQSEHIISDSAFIDFEMNQVVFMTEKNSQRIVDLANLKSRVLK